MNTLQLVGLVLVLPAVLLAGTCGLVIVRRRAAAVRVRTEAIDLLGNLTSDSAQTQADLEAALAGLRADDGANLAERLPEIARTGRRHEQRLGSAHVGLERLAATERPLAAAADEVARQRDRVGAMCRTAEDADPNEPAVAVAAVTLAVSDVLRHERSLRDELTDAKARLEARAGRLSAAERDRFTDPLTRLPNRRAFLREANGLSDGESPRPFAVAVFLVEAPEAVEAAAGDAVMSVAARVVRESVRPGDYAARTGTREFAVLMPRADAAAAAFVARTVRRASKTATVRLADGTASFGLTWGVAVSRPGLTPDLALDEAREAQTQTQTSDPGRLLSGNEGTLSRPKVGSPLTV